jgi:hypothetical protein
MEPREPSGRVRPTLGLCRTTGQSLGSIAFAASGQSLGKSRAESSRRALVRSALGSDASHGATTLPKNHPALGRAHCTASPALSPRLAKHLRA